jgi:hypothetical protein
LAVNFLLRATQNNNLWQGVNGINNPCPNGFRLPTEDEFWDLGFTNAATAFSSTLKLQLTGERSQSTGALGEMGSFGFYWSSTVSGTNARRFGFNSSGQGVQSSSRANGHSVRCIKN